jgi:hypothetical protein
MLEHMSWYADSLIISLPKQKNDQEGSRDYPRHIYANVYQPAICPILALGIQIFGKSFRTSIATKKSYRLFEGEDQEGRYSDILSKTTKALTQEEELIIGRNKKKKEKKKKTLHSFSFFFSLFYRC